MPVRIASAMHRTSRTFPVNGKFSPEQLRYTTSCWPRRKRIKEIRPGKPFGAYHDTAVRHDHGRADSGLLKGGVDEHPRADVPQVLHARPVTGLAWTCTTSATTASTARPPARTGHGRHGRTRHLYRAGCQGVAAKWRGIGIRIGDDVVVTRGEAEVLTSAVPNGTDG